MSEIFYSIFHSYSQDDTQSSESNIDPELQEKNNEKEYEKRCISKDVNFEVGLPDHGFPSFSHSGNPVEFNPSSSVNLTEVSKEVSERHANYKIKNDDLLEDSKYKFKFGTEKFEFAKYEKEELISKSENHCKFTANVVNLNIISSREQINFMTNDCTMKNFQERDNILALQSKTHKLDICKKRLENLCLQQKEFDNFIGSLKAEIFSEQTVVDHNYTESILKTVQKECDLFKQFFPAYGYRKNILNAVANNQVTIISADSVYFFNIFLPLLLNNEYCDLSIFSCESNKILSQILQEKINRVISEQNAEDQKLFDSKVIITSEKQLLDHLCQTNFFCDSEFCAILNLSLKRSIITDILLANIADLLVSCKNSRLILLVSYCDSVLKYEQHFSQNLTTTSLIFPSLVLPVKTMWKSSPSYPDKDFVDDVVQTVFAIHTLCEPGDIITFLPSDEDVKLVFAALDSKLDYHQFDNLKVVCISENSITSDFMITVFSNSPVRKVFLVPSDYEGLIIPSVLYVIDSGIKKEFSFDINADINIAAPSFISCTRAKMRKELAGTYDIGMCIRMYNKVNYTKEMYAEKEHAEIFCINPMHSMIKILQFRPSIVEAIQFVEVLPIEIQVKTMKLLRDWGAVDKDLCITPFGKKFIKLPFSSKYSRFILHGIECGFTYEAIILIAYFFTKKTIKDVFMESKDDKCQKLIDTVKLEFNQLESDTLTFLNIFKTGQENGFKKLWCEKNYINFNTLKCVRSKVNDIRYIVIESLGENIKEEFSTMKDQQDLIQMLFECFQEYLCVYTGHHQTGYQILSSKNLALVHSSSVLYENENPPQFVIYDELLCTNGYFLSNITSVPFEFIAEKLNNGTICFSKSDILEEKLIKRTIEPVGEKVITQALLKNEGKKVKEIEERIKKESGAEVVLIEPVLGKGCVNIYAFHPYILLCFCILDDILKDSINSIMNEEETQIVYLRKGNNSIALEILWSKGCKTESIKPLLHGVKLVNNPSCSPSEFVENDLESLNISSINYSLKLFIPRRICTGEGFINFNDSKDFQRARRLALRYISVDKVEAQVFVEVSNVRENQLHILEIPPEVSKEDLFASFSNLLQGCTFEVELCYLPSFVTTDQELLSIRKQIEDNCKNYTNLMSFDVKVSKPEPSSNYTYANVNVFEERCLNKEAKNLSAGKVNKMNILCKPLYFSNIKCSANIYQSLKYRIKEELTVYEQEHLKNYEEKYFKVEPKKCEGIVTIHLSSNDVEVIKAVQMRINCLLDGIRLSKSNLKQIKKLFCHGGHVFLKTLEKTCNICIVTNFETKTIRLFGLQENCNYAVQSILDFLEDTENETVKSIPLSREKCNRLLLKEIIMKYGPNLEKFIEMHGLRTAVLDIKTSCLLLFGKNDSIYKAEESLNELSRNIDFPSICTNLTSEEICPVCMCPAANLTYRLELCGHLYCSECIRGLIEQYDFPIQCCAKDCSKDVILGDIKYILDDDNEKLQELADKSMKYFLERNQERLFHCPAADCAMFVFRNELHGDKWKCPLCQNFICVKCNVIFHDGYSCDIYQGSKMDPDYSFKVWQRTSTKCKHCPKCNTAIEKREGCNHMICSSCKCHFCWICVTAFPTGNDVYIHINRTHVGLLFND